MPVLTSRLPLRSVYLWAALSRRSGTRLISHITKNAESVHVQTGTPTIMEVAALSRLSNQTIIMPRTMASTVLATTAGVIHGFPVQITAEDCAVFVDNC